LEEQQRVKSNSFLKGLVTGLALSLVIVAVGFLTVGIYMRFGAGSRDAETSAQGGKDGDGSENGGAGGRLKVDGTITRKMGLIEKIITDYFYEDGYDDQEMEDGIYRGMVASLGDPYSEYYSAEELKQVQEQTEGIFFGIGAILTLDEDTGFGMIKEVKPDTPAQKSGVKDGDLIYAVDGTSTYGMSLSEIVSMIRGEEHTDVVLTLVRESEADLLDITVTRERVEEETVVATMYENGIGYIQITEFDEVTVSQFNEGLKMLKADGLKGLILDLRSNPGGSLSAVVDIARMMLPEGLIVYTEDREGKRSEYKSDGKNKLEVPMVVLINGASASASEILAGAIKDYDIGTLMGTTTFGKGIVQRVISLSDGSAVKLTISTYYTPNGNNIHGIGIEPDVECIFNADAYYDNRYDNQLEKAREYLSGELGVKYTAPENAP